MIRRREFLAAAAAASEGRAVFAEPETAAPRVRGFERRIFDRVNEVRVQCGSPALAWNDAIWAEASVQSARKAIVQFPGHVDPERGDIAQRLNSRGLAWSQCGENLFWERGYDDPVNLAIVCWWYSAGHRKTMLTPEFTETAVGVAIGPDHRIYAAQIFLTPRDAERPGARLQAHKCPESAPYEEGSRRAHESKFFRKLFGKG